MTPEQDARAIEAMRKAAAINVDSFARRMLNTFESPSSACFADRQMTIELHRPSAAVLQRFDELLKNR